MSYLLCHYIEGFAKNYHEEINHLLPLLEEHLISTFTSFPRWMNRSAEAVFDEEHNQIDIRTFLFHMKYAIQMGSEIPKGLKITEEKRKKRNYMKKVMILSKTHASLVESSILFAAALGNHQIS